MYKRIIPPETLKGTLISLNSKISIDRFFILVGEMFTKQSDVFSYGLILYELLTFKKADHTAIKLISSLNKQFFGPETESGVNTYIELTKLCTAQEPEKRPLFEELLESLEELQEKVH